MPQERPDRRPDSSENRIRHRPAVLPGLRAETALEASDMNEKAPEWQKIIAALAEAVDALKQCDPYLDADDVERASMARHLIRRIMREIVSGLMHDYAAWCRGNRPDLQNDFYLVVYEAQQRLARMEWDSKEK
jgi:hypothetical protein